LVIGLAHSNDGDEGYDVMWNITFLGPCDYSLHTPTSLFKVASCLLCCRWVGVWLWLIGSLVIFFTGLFTVLQKTYGERLHLPHHDAGFVGLFVSYALQVHMY